MKFQLGDKLYLIVTKFNGYPQLQFRNCVTKNATVVPTRVGINLILPQYVKLKSACDELLEHSDLNEPCEKDLGFGLSARNKLCIIKCKTVRKVVFFNDRKNGSFEITLPEFKKWCEYHNQIEEAIAKVKIEIADKEAVKNEENVQLDFVNSGMSQMELDFTQAEIAPMENTFIHLCALIARRAVNQCFPCLACHKSLPWEESSRHTCIVEEGEDLQNKSMKKN